MMHEIGDDPVCRILSSRGVDLGSGGVPFYPRSSSSADARRARKVLDASTVFAVNERGQVSKGRSSARVNDTQASLLGSKEVVPRYVGQLNSDLGKSGQTSSSQVKTCVLSEHKRSGI